ncbi:MAG TPA: hypothetical protein VEW28_04995 [Candidatus Kapabacteria bacterium]|nr:hypothetical protein [Candidatus Kapabacteria bacterium]
MKGNWIYILAFIFFILRAFANAAKKKNKPNQKDELLKSLADQTRKKRLAEINENVRVYSESSANKIKQNVPARTTRDDTNFESAYASASYDDAPASKPDAAANIINDAGVTSAGYKETTEERAAYDVPVAAKIRLLPNLTSSTYRQFIIAKEVLDKPKSMQKMKWQ